MVPCDFCFLKGSAGLRHISRNPGLKPKILGKSLQKPMQKKVDKSRHQDGPRNISFSRDIHQKQPKVDNQKSTKSRQPDFTKKPCGQPDFIKVDRKWTESGWTECGQKVDRKWTASGQKLDRKWAASGQKVERKWTESG